MSWSEVLELPLVQSSTLEGRGTQSVGSKCPSWSWGPLGSFLGRPGVLFGASRAALDAVKSKEANTQSMYVFPAYWDGLLDVLEPSSSFNGMVDILEAAECRFGGSGGPGHAPGSSCPNPRGARAPPLPER
eukprot:9178636-Pyramimonas_sp.AAC.2